MFILSPEEHFCPHIKEKDEAYGIHLRNSKTLLKMNYIYKTGLKFIFILTKIS